MSAGLVPCLAGFRVGGQDHQTGPHLAMAINAREFPLPLLFMFLFWYILLLIPDCTIMYVTVTP